MTAIGDISPILRSPTGALIFVAVVAALTYLAIRWRHRQHESRTFVQYATSFAAHFLLALAIVFAFGFVVRFFD